MLNAILNSKAGRLHTDEERSVRWKELFRGSEDLITATVLERLSYLPAEVAWGLLVEASSGQLPSFRVAELAQIHFWPMWGAEGRVRGVEPDVFLAFELGDPSRRAEVILEAKHGGQQYEAQWEAEITAWAEAVSDEDAKLPDLLIMLAIGGIPDRRAQNIRRTAFIEDIRRRSPQLPDLSVVMIGWQDLARACAGFSSVHKHEERVVADIRSGLELCGYFHQIRPRQLEQLATQSLYAETLNELMGSNALASKRIGRG